MLIAILIIQLVSLLLTYRWTHPRTVQSVPELPVAPPPEVSRHWQLILMDKTLNHIYAEVALNKPTRPYQYVWGGKTFRMYQARQADPATWLYREVKV
jgi:hypothetical protein